MILSIWGMRAATHAVGVWATISAHTPGDQLHPGNRGRGGRIRRLMPRESLRLQGFAEEQIDKILAFTSDAQAYKQAGNSVTVTVIEAIGRCILAVDEEPRKMGDAGMTGLKDQCFGVEVEMSRYHP